MRNSTILKDCSARLQQRGLLSAWNAWLNFACEKAEHRHKVALSLNRLTNRLAFTAFSTWRDWTVYEKELRIRLQVQPSP